MLKLSDSAGKKIETAGRRLRRCRQFQFFSGRTDSYIQHFRQMTNHDFMKLPKNSTFDRKTVTKTGIYRRFQRKMVAQKNGLYIKPETKKLSVTA